MYLARCKGKGPKLTFLCNSKCGPLTLFPLLTSHRSSSITKGFDIILFIRVLLPLTAIRLVAGKRLGGSKKGTVSRRPRLNSVIRGDVCLSRSLPSLPVPATVAAYSLPLLPPPSESFLLLYLFFSSTRFLSPVFLLG